MSNNYTIIKTAYSAPIAPEIYNTDIEKLLLLMPDKIDSLKTTSRLFKNDVYNFFNKPEFKNKIGLELGCYKCYTTIILSKVLKKVYGVNLEHYDSIEPFLKENECTNVEVIIHDIYSNGIPIKSADVIMIDAVHSYDAVKLDIINSLKLSSVDKKYFIFDDYGTAPEIKKAVTEFCTSNVIKVIQKIGHASTDTFTRPLYDFEGIICVEV